MLFLLLQLLPAHATCYIPQGYVDTGCYEEDAACTLGILVTSDVQGDGETCFFTAIAREWRNGDPATSQDAAIEGTDFMYSAVSLSVQSGSIVYIDVPMVDDDEHDSGEVFTLELVPGAGMDPGDQQHNIGILDWETDATEDDFMARRAPDCVDTAGHFRPCDPEEGQDGIWEDSAYVVFEVRRGRSGPQLDVDYRTQAITATAGADFGSVAGTTTFYPGDTLSYLWVPLHDDPTVEGDETLEMMIDWEVGPSQWRADYAGVTIVDDDSEG